MTSARAVNTWFPSAGTLASLYRSKRRAAQALRKEEVSKIRIFLILGATFIVLLCSPHYLSAQMTDIITTEIGGRVIGEIKKFERGLLEIKTDEMSTLSIQWDMISSIQSTKLFDIETYWGEHYFGSLEPAEETGKVKIIIEIDSVILSLDDIVALHPLESRFWSRIKGYLDAGFSYQTANDFAELVLGTEIKYYGEKWFNTLNLDTYLRTQREGERTRRNNLRYHLERVFKKRWSGDLFAALEQNDELELDMRAMIGLGGGKDLIQNNRMVFKVFGGADVINEKRFGDEEFSTQFEAMFGATFDTFRYYTPKYDISADLTLHPNLTEFGRLRINFNTRLRYEVLHNFFIGLTVFDRFDGDLREGGARKNDFGINTTISWGFR